MDILNFAYDVISVPLPENKENFLYNQLISENIEGVVFHETFLKSVFRSKIGCRFVNLGPFLPNFCIYDVTKGFTIWEFLKMDIENGFYILVLI